MLPLAEPDAVELFCTAPRSNPQRGRGALSSPGRAAARDRAGGGANAGRSRRSRSSTGSASGSICFEGGRDADPRQATLRATIEWSYDLLAPGGTELVRRLAVFDGGCTLEAVEHGMRGRPRHAPAAGREEPRPPYRRSLLDAGDDPGVRDRPARKRGRPRCDSSSALGTLSHVGRVRQPVGGERRPGAPGHRATRAGQFPRGDRLGARPCSRAGLPPGDRAGAVLGDERFVRGRASARGAPRARLGRLTPCCTPARSASTGSRPGSRGISRPEPA